MQAVEREILFNNWITIVVVFSITLLFLMKVFQPNRLIGYSISFFTKGFMVQRATENPSYLSRFHLSLLLFSSLTLSLFFYLQLEHKLNGLYGFSTIALTTICFISFRIFLDLMLTKILGVSEYLKYFLLTKTGYLYNLCLWLFPAIIFVLYSYKNPNILLYFFILLVTLRFVLILANNKKLISSQLFYFILYLCTLEIAPLFILYKLTI